jgi:signal transduction histidine kinase
MAETLRTGKSAHVIHEMREGDQATVYGNIVTYPLKDQTGKIIRIIEIWRDITDEISLRLERRVEQLKANLNQLVAEDRMISLGKLVASCVHEINNPIQGLLTFSSIMQEILAVKRPEAKELAEFREYLDLMTTELERCGRIVSGLLSFSRESPLEYTDTDLNEVVLAVISLTRHRMALQNIELRKHLARSPLMVLGDANRLQQCLLNLVFNAMEAMPDGGRLSLRTKRDRACGNVCLSIEDTGHGISPEDLDHIFDPFFTTKRQGEGTGLGLSIVYGVVKNHQGKVRVNSRPGKGSTFNLSFPDAGSRLQRGDRSHGYQTECDGGGR